jgi:hypothetical protein
MKPRAKHILAVAVVVLLLMVLFPPYFGVYDQPGANLHTSLGMHPIWDPPSLAEAYVAIHGESHDAALQLPAAERSRVTEERLALTRVGFNKVGFVFEVVVLALVSSVVGLLRRRQLARRQGLT